MRGGGEWMKGLNLVLGIGGQCWGNPNVDEI